MADGSVIIDTQLDQTGLRTGLASLGTVATKGIKTALVGATAALAGFGAYSVSVGSEFEASMDKVLSISGASEAEFIQLSEKAKQMGASTKFTAAESADAFKYMAMAGWDAESMLQGIDGIMSLAAADGLDIATTSDIVTDALTAFGLKAEDATHFADVLATAASNANTNVSMMGETFKYVAPVAGSMGIKVEDTAEAIGLMANAGIKSSMAGTTLRQVLSRLATDAGASSSSLGALGVLTQELGVEFYNTDGSVRDLNDVLSEARTAWKGLSAEQQANYAKTIAGQQGLAGWNALMNASEEDVNKLRDAIANCDGTASQMAETMQDNVSGQLTILKSAAEGLGIAVYESLQTPLKDAIIEAQNYVDRLHEAFDSDGLSGMIEEAGSIIGELAVKIAEHAPEMVDAAVNFIESFVKAIFDNKEKLLEAAKKIVSTIVDGLIKLLPKEIQKPAKEAVNTLKNSFNNGGLKKAIQTVGNIIKNVGKILSSLAKVILPVVSKAIDFLAGKTRFLVIAATAMFTAYKAYKIFTAAAAAIKVHTAAVTAESLAEAASTGAITLKQIALGLLTGQLSLATAAQYALNLAMSLNPVGIVIAAVAALTAGLVAFALSAGDASDKTKELEEAQERLSEANTRLGGTYEEIGSKFSDFASQIDSAGSIFDNFNESILISDEDKQALDDNMSSVQDEITEICRLAAEERRELTGGEIQRLDELFEKMHELSEQELALEQSKQGVVTTQAEALNNAAGISLDEYTQRAQKLVNSAEETRTSVIDKAYEQYTEEVALLNLRLETEEGFSQEEYEQKVAAAESQYQSAIEAANKEAGDTLAILEQGYLDRATALSTGTQRLSSLNSAEEEENQLHATKLSEIDSWYQQKKREILAAGYNDKTEGAKLGSLANQKARKEQEEDIRHENKLETLRNTQNKVLSGKKYQDQLTAFLNLEGLYETYTGRTYEQAGDIVNAFYEPMQNMDEETYNAFANAVQGGIDGLESKESSLYWKALNIANSVVSIFTRAWDEHSPSKRFRKIFGLAIEGGEGGFDDETPKLLKQADEIAEDVAKSLTPEIDYSDLVAAMQGVVGDQRVKVGAVVSGGSVTETYRRGGGSSGNDDASDPRKPEYIQNDIYVDGRKTARIITPYVAKEIDWEAK